MLLESQGEPEGARRRRERDGGAESRREKPGSIFIL